MASKTLQVRSGRRAEAPFTLDEPAPRALGLLDQLGLWGNLGVSILGFTGAFYILLPTGYPPALSLGAALLALVFGTLLGTAAVALVAVAGAETGAADDGVAARAARRPVVVVAERAQRHAAGRLDDLRAGHHQHRDAPDHPGVARWVYVSPAAW